MVTKINSRSSAANKMNVIKAALVTVSMIGLAASCSKSNVAAPAGSPAAPVDCSGAPKTYSGDVRPLIATFCGGCHGAGSGNGPGALINYNQVFNARASIRSAVSSGRMPQNATLTSSQKNLILCWVDSGAPNN